MATTITKGLIGKEDLSIQSSSTETFSRATSSGGSQTMTKFGRHTLNTREYDVMQWGAVGDGTTDDTAAIQAALDEAEAAGGGMLVFPAGYTFRVQPPTVNLPIFQIGSGNLTFAIRGDMKVTATTSLDPTTAANEQLYAYIFKAIGYDDIRFEGPGTIDGNRDDGTQDPRYGFFFGAKCSNVTITGLNFINFNASNGVIVGAGWDAVAGTGERIENWALTHNRVEKALYGFNIYEAHRGITITDNEFVSMDLGPYGASGPGYTWTGYSPSQERLCRSIRTTGYGNTDAGTHGDIENVVVARNRLYGGAWSIELWNSDATNGQNPDHARGIVVADNMIWGTHGISVNHFGNVSITGNTFSKLLTSDLATYPGRYWNSGGTSTTGLTTVPFGHGIEAAPNLNQVISGNSIDSGWTNAVANGNSDGITIGGTDCGYNPTATVVGNEIRRCYRGIRLGQTENSLIANNRIAESRQCIETYIDSQTTRVSGSGFTWKGNVLRGNTFIADETAHASGGSGATLVEVDGDWVIDDNDFTGPTTASQVTGWPMLTIGGFASTYGGTLDISSAIVTNNRFTRFEFWCISNQTSSSRGLLRAHYSNNYFDSGDSSPAGSQSPLRINRPEADYSPVITANRNTAYRVTQPMNVSVPTLWLTATAYTVGQVRYETASGVLYVCEEAHTSGTFATDLGAGKWSVLTETYDFGEWVNDGTFTALWKNTSLGASITGGFPVVGFGPRRKAMQLRTNSGTATVDVASFFPAESAIIGVRGEVTTTITMGGGGTTWSLGCPFWMNGTQLAHTSALTNGNTDAWGTGLALTAGTDIEPSTWRTPAYSFTTGTAAATLRLTANTGTFTDGYVTLILDYVPLTEDVI